MMVDSLRTRNMMWFLSLLLVYLVPQVLSECAQYPIQEVDLKQMSGMWYLHYKSADAKELHPDYKCMRNYYSMNPDGVSADFVEAMLPLSNTKTWEGKSFYTTVTKNSTNGSLYMKVIDPKVGEVDLPFYVLSTDYSTHLITYVCYQGMKGTWILSKEKTDIHTSATRKVEAALKKAKLSLDSFVATPQEDCP